MVRLGGLTSKYYKETKGIKVTAGQFVTSGTILTRQGNKWKSGLNVVGRMHVTAACDGEVYFTKRKGHYGSQVTFVHIRPIDKKTKSKGK